jgi:Leucine-rich repeat (LRR) protein
MAVLGLEQLPELKVLDLHGNDIQRICGLNYCSSLRELVLDKNKIKAFDAISFVGLSELRELRLQVRAVPQGHGPCMQSSDSKRLIFVFVVHTLQENGLKSLAYIEQLESLQVLTVGHNRIR